MISYGPLWETMKARSITTYALINKHGFSPYTITNLKRNKSITMNTLEALCKVLDCTADNVVEFTDEEGQGVAGEKADACQELCRRAEMWQELLEALDSCSEDEMRMLMGVANAFKSALDKYSKERK